ncbi:unnamed protein product [Meganyctiphanes norvegica]|uniref:Alkaline phosphatase n=1 Tax=Meganyctiphanes norvegica TaxID=48144 RepID=A0AAV2PM67_MEGNR
MNKFHVLLLAICLTTHGFAAAGVKRFKTKVDEGQEYWNDVGREELDSALNVQLNTNVAKNVILFLGDGMSIATQTAARIYKAQKESRGGEESKLAFEDFPHVGFSKTYCVDKQVPDSAATATAFLTGVKANFHTVGVDNSVKNKDCSTFSDEGKVDSIVKWAQEAGKRTGLVTSTRITHATPASAYAHSPEREWECDAYIKEDIGDDWQQKCSTVKDIAKQLIEDEPGSHINVLMGGGLKAFGQSHDVRWDDDWDCDRLDGADLINEWNEKKTKEESTHAFVKTRTELMEVDDSTEYLLGLFHNGHLPWEHVKVEDELDIPTLAEMTKKAITMLQKGDNGFFLMVEGGRIDHGHHDSTAHRALDEAVAMDNAVEEALKLTDEEDTLIVVTADHAHAMTFNGYPKRGQEIVGLASLADDDLPMTTLMYSTGPGFNYTTIDGDVVRWNLTGVNVQDFENLQQGEAYTEAANHGGEDVSIYASGPMSHLFHSLHEQNYIAHAMAYAACIGANNDIGSHCKESTSTTEATTTDGAKTTIDPNTWTYVAIGLGLPAIYAIFAIFAAVQLGRWCYGKKGTKAAAT